MHRAVFSPLYHTDDVTSYFMGIFISKEVQNVETREL